MKKTTMLKKNYEFRAVLTRGKCFKEKEIEIFILKNNKKRNFLGIAISSKSGTILHIGSTYKTSAISFICRGLRALTTSFDVSARLSCNIKF